MTEREFDARLRDALADAAMDELRPALAGADELEIEWSPDYLRRITLLLNGAARTAQKAARPRWRGFLRAAACAILAAALLFGTLLTVSAQVRAWAWELVSQWLDVSTGYVFHGDRAEDYDVDAVWRPTYVPEGYREVEAQGANGDWNVMYADAEDNRIHLDYMPVQQGMGFSVDNEHASYRRVAIQDGLGDLYLSNDPEWPSRLIWMDSSGRTAFMLSGFLTEEELLKTAESVDKRKS